MPRLSVVIAAKNEERYLLEQLLALQTQAVRPDEIVLVDDGSTDRTLELMQEFAGAVPGVRIISLPESVGCARATNRGVAEATGTHVYVASANDVVSPAAIRAIAEALRAYPDAHLITGDVSGIHLGWGDPTGAVSTPSYLDADAVSRVLGGAGIIHAAGTVISREAWDRYGGWAPAWFPYSETLCWHVTACRYGAVYTPNQIASVRVHEGSASTTVLDREWRRPLMQMAAHFVDDLEEPARSRLLGSRLWDIREWAPEMRPLLLGTEKLRRAREPVGV